MIGERRARDAGAQGPPLPPGRLAALSGRDGAWILESQGPPGAPTLLLLHGWTATAALNWFSAFPALGRRYRVVAMDLRGHGRGSRKRPFSLHGCADDAAALCRGLGLTRVIAVGYSMGGAVAQLLWRRHPAAVAGLVLCATSTHFAGTGPLDPAVTLAGQGLAFGLTVGMALVPLALQWELSRWALRRRFAATGLGTWALEQRTRHDIAAMVSAGIALRRYDARPWIATIDVPTAVVAMTADRVVAPSRQLAMAAAIPGATTFPIDADHMACAEKADTFVPALLAACGDVATRSGGDQ